MGSRWFDEIKEEFQFAMLCRGDTKVFISSNSIIMFTHIINDY